MPRLPDPDLAERRRRQILDAALVCFRRRGFHKASMQEICAEASMSAGAIYRYFESKTDIIAAIAEDEHDGIASELATLDPSAPALPAIEAILQRGLSKVAELGGSLIADVLAEASRNPALAERLSQDRPMLDAIVELVRRGQARGELDRGIAPETAARLIATYMDGRILNAAVGLVRENAEEAAADLRAFLHRLLRPEPAVRDHCLEGTDHG